MTRKRLIQAALAVAVFAGAGWLLFAPGDTEAQSVVAVTIPELSREAQAGELLFEGNCAECHGKFGIGTEKGPPFLHRIYEPNHHGDIAFVLAAQNGVRAHHWKFGNMPPVQGVTPEDVTKIVSYVRALQRANGIE